jgi:hypothetical protein
VRAAVLTTGRRPVRTLRRTVRSQTSGHVSSSHRVLSQRRWSSWALAHPLITDLLDRVGPPGPVLLGGDDTVTAPPGPTVFGTGRQRDGVRASHRYTADRWGHQWVGISMLVKWPFTARPGALPIVVAVDRPPEWARLPGRRQKTPAPLARLRLARRLRWFPPPHCILVGDSGDGTSATARFGSQHRRARTLVRTCYGDAALYAPPPPRTHCTLGRPRVKGPQRASPPEVMANTAKRISLTGAW